MSQREPVSISADEIRSRLSDLRWYHTIDVLPGVATNGWFDLRHALALIPWPDVRGKRCLDIGTWDGFYAYELERRGAAEVIAIDVPDLSDIDYPPEVRALGADLAQVSKQPRPAGFRLLNEIMDSSVRWRAQNVYELDPADIGMFDVVVCGSLLVHLRDPVRALDAIRRVTSGFFLSIDYFDPVVDLLSRVTHRRAIFELRGEGRDFQWWLASQHGLRRLLTVSGFEIEAASKPFLLRPGSEYRPQRSFSRRDVIYRLTTWLVTRDGTRGGHPHRAFLTRPRF